jgi:Na+/glutamate symporter
MVVTVKYNNRLKILVIALAALLLLGTGVGIGVSLVKQTPADPPAAVEMRDNGMHGGHGHRYRWGNP